MKGDSMEPIYVEGDLLVVAPNIQANDNDVVIVKTIEKRVLFKRLKKPTRVPDDAFQFLTLNPQHFRADEIYRISVVHRVIRPPKETVRAVTVSESTSL